MVRSEINPAWKLGHARHRGEHEPSHRTVKFGEIGKQNLDTGVYELQQDGERTRRILSYASVASTTERRGVEKVSVTGPEARMPKLVQFAVRQAAFRLARRQPEISQDLADRFRQGPHGNAEHCAERKPLAGRTKSNVRSSTPDEHRGNEWGPGNGHEPPHPRPSAGPLRSNQRPTKEPNSKHDPQFRCVHVIGARVAIEAGVIALPMENWPELLVVGIEQVVEAIAEF